MFTATLIGPDGLSRSEVFVCDQVEVGRDPACAIVVETPRVRLRHLRLSYEPDGVVLSYLPGSGAQGVEVNGRPLRYALPVGPGDVIEMGAYALRVSAPHLPDSLDFGSGERPPLGGGANGVLDTARLLLAVDEGDRSAAHALYREGLRRGDLVACARAIPLAAPCPLAWHALVFALSRWPGDAPLQPALEAIARHLGGWPDALRTAPSTWWGNVAHGVHEPRFALARSLDVGTQANPGDALIALTSSPQSKDLTNLVLGSSRLDANAVLKIARAGALGSLRALDISRRRLPLSAWIGFLEAPLLEQLDRLAVSGCELCDEAAQRAARSPSIRGLSELDLSHNAIGDQGARALARSPHVKGLERLDLRGNPIGREGVYALRTTVRLREGALRI